MTSGLGSNGELSFILVFNKLLDCEASVKWKMSREFLENLELCVVEEMPCTVRRCQLSTGGTYMKDLYTEKMENT